MLLRRLRKKIKIIMWATLILVVPAFIWWGVGGLTSAKKNLVAKVNGFPITLEHFRNEYNFLYNRYALLFADLEESQFHEKIRSLNLEKQTLEHLVENLLIGQEIKRRRIKITDDEIARAIKKHPVFLSSNGSFDKERFERATQSVPLSQWQVWQKQIRSMLAFEKLKREFEDPASEEADKESAYNHWLAGKKAQAEIEIINLPKLN